MACNANCATCTAEIRLNEFNAFKEKYKAINNFEYDPIKYSNPSAVMLSVTDDCNLACPYCFVQQKPNYMTFDIADKTAQWLLKNKTNRNDNSKPILNFFGGEPLLCFDTIIKPLVEKYKNQISFGITTNGILLDEDKVDFFNKNKFTLLLSVDGGKEVQNAQRPAKIGDSFEQVLRNIPYLLLRMPNTVMRSTVTKQSIPYIYKTVLMAEELGFKKIVFCPNAFEDWGKDEEVLLEKQFKTIGLHIYKKLRTGQPAIQVDPLNKLYTNLGMEEKNTLRFNNSLLRCGLGTVACSVNYNGYIVPCQEKTSHPTTIIGNIQTGIDTDIHKQFLENYYNKINNLTCDKGCNDKDKLICLSDICPSRMEDLNYTFSTASCAFLRMALKTAKRLRFLCARDINPKISLYFGEGGGINSCLI